eukprot:TRINITY_DN1264_c0_g1_i10.p1 TRINITY_DN1264_c0_g1~~TRINITY_DN1264_c0_g1_i10.p1  ORF type:complete len:162 (-),score=23.49 TRINITY_DN1264_c0_g1_i10:167-652(-)
MAFVPLTYLARFPSSQRRILEIVCLWGILTTSQVEQDIWIPGLGKDLTVALIVIFLGLALLAVRLWLFTKCDHWKIFGFFVWRYVPCGLLMVGIAVGSKVAGDKWGCYVGLHSTWHFGIMMTMFFLYLTKETSTTQEFDLINEVPLEVIVDSVDSDHEKRL